MVFANCSYYDNPCELLSAFETSGFCPAQLAAHGLPCMCPFNPATINLPPSVFHVTHLNTAWLWILRVSIRLTWIAIHNNQQAFRTRSPNLYAFFCLGSIPSTSRNNPWTWHRRMRWSPTGHPNKWRRSRPSVWITHILKVILTVGWSICGSSVPIIWKADHSFLLSWKKK